MKLFQKYWSWSERGHDIMDLYAFGKAVCGLVLKPIYRFEVIGADNIPMTGPVLLCSNHINNFDPPVVGIFSKRTVCFMAKEELFHSPLFGKILRGVQAFPVKRGLSDREALRTGLKILKDGKVLGLFPEGTRSKDGVLGKGLAGAGFFALRSEALIIPTAIIGPYKLFGKVKVIYGSPIDMSHMREKKISAEDATAIIMNEIQKLIEKYQ